MIFFQIINTFCHFHGSFTSQNLVFHPKITWFSLAAKILGNMPYYTGSKTFGDIVSFAKANLNSNTSEPNLQD